MLDRQIVGALLYRIFIYWCFSVLTVSLVILTYRVATHQGSGGSFLEFLALDNLFIQYGAVFVASLILVPIVMLDSLTTSNQFVLPMERMRRSLRALAAGESVEHIQFRENDLLQDWALEFNKVVDRLAQLEKESRCDEATNAIPGDLEPASI